MATTFDVPTATASNTQKWGEEEEEDAIYSVTLKRVRYYSDNSVNPDDDEPVAQLLWQTCKVRTLRAATLDRLIANLAPDEEDIDPTYIQMFLCTYRAYTDTASVLEKLIKRYHGVGANNGRELIERSVRTVLRMWMDLYPDDFDSPPYHRALMTLIKFVEEEIPCGAMEEVGTRSKKLFLHFSTAVNEAEIGQKDPDCVDPNRSHFNFLSFQPSDVACQLTIIDSKLFCQVVPYQTMGCVWGKRNKSQLAPTVLRTVQQFNRISMLVVTSILFEGKLGESSSEQMHVKGPHARSKVISRWLAVASECRQMKNFASLKAILSGLQSSPIHRLKKTWAVVSKDNKEVFDELSELFSQEKNQQNTRQLLMKEGTAKYSQTAKKKKVDSNLILGVVPYLGTFLTDLMMIDTAYPSKVRGDLINFEKRRKEFEVLAQLTLFQKAAANYVIPEDKHLQELVMNVDLLSEQESYEMSCKVESMESEGDASPQKGGTFTQKFRSLFTSKPITLPSDLSISEPTTPTGISCHDVAVKVRDRSKTLPDHRRMSLDICEKQNKLETRLSLSNTLSPTSCIIRVAMSESGDTHCMYKSLLLKCDVRTPTVVAMALEKLGVDGLAKDYNLLQLVNPKKKLHIPNDANVYYAMDTSAQQLRFVLERKQQQQRSVSQDNLLGVPSNRRHTRARSVSPSMSELTLPEKMSVGASWMQNLPISGVQLNQSRSTVDLLSSPVKQQLFRPSQMTCIVRVALDCAESTACLYKSMLLTCNDHTPAVITSMMDKLAIDDEPKDYDLVYVTDAKKRIVIPHDANVFYAIDNNSDTVKLLLSRKTDRPALKITVNGSASTNSTNKLRRLISPDPTTSSLQTLHSNGGLKLSRSNVDLSRSPPPEQQLFGRSETTCVIRVAHDTEEDACVYKSMLLTCNDRTTAVITSAIEKLGIHGEPSDYDLVFLQDGKKRVSIPPGANVFYAVDNTIDNLQFVLSHKADKSSSTSVSENGSAVKLSRHSSFNRSRSMSPDSSALTSSSQLSNKLSRSSTNLSIVDSSIAVVPPFGGRNVPFTTLPTSQIIRIAHRQSEIKSCVYKSLMLTCDDRASSVIEASMEKLGLDGLPNQYVLIQEIEPRKLLRFPHNSNVFYAMDSSANQFSFLLERRQPKDVRL